MSNSSNSPSFEFFEVTYPIEYVAHVQINRPQKLNAFISNMWLEMRHIFDSLSYSPSVRAIILTGAGPKAFTAGLDIQSSSQSGPLAPTPGEPSRDVARIATTNRRHILEIQECVQSVEKCEKPVVCVMHGFTLGLGIDIATCADIRICSSDTKFAVKEVDIGLAADVGTLSRLPKIVGNSSWVKDVSLSARTFGAEEALRVGFVSGVYASKDAAVDEATRWAGIIAGKSPVAVQATKELLNWSRDHSVQDGLRYTAVWNGAALQSNDVTAAMQAGLAKRKPTFEKL